MIVFVVTCIAKGELGCLLAKLSFKVTGLVARSLTTTNEEQSSHLVVASVNSYNSCAANAIRSYGVSEAVGKTQEHP